MSRGSPPRDASPSSKSKYGFIFKQLFKSLDGCDETDPFEISPEQLRLVYCCSNFSKAIYESPKKREIPKEIGTILIESQQSDKYLIPFIITYSSYFKSIFVCYRGSYCVNDIIVDFKCFPIKVKNGQIHAGVYLTAQEMIHQTLTLIHNYAVEYKCSVIFTGHSLGASCAAIVCSSFRENYPEIPARTIAFAPASSHSYELWKQTRSFVDSYIIFGDFVPFVNLYNIENTSKIIWPPVISNAIKKAIQIGSQSQTHLWEPIDVHIKPPDYNPFTAPPPPISELPIFNIPPPQATLPLYPVGEFYLFIFNENDQKPKVELRKIKDCSYFERFTSDLNEYNHMMGFYKECINTFYESYKNDHPESLEILSS